MTVANAATTLPGHDLLAGSVVAVTAAAGTGIGSAVARRCLLEGARVVISDAHSRRLAVTEEQLRAEYPEQVAAVTCDVTAEDDVARLLDTARDTWGRLDVLVNNAGLGGQTALVDMTDDQWNRVVDITLGGTFRCTRAALRYFRDAGHGGVIVNNASVLGWRAQREQAHYAAAKAGVMALTRCSAAEATEYGVRVNAVAPSIAVHEHLAKSADPELLADLASRELFGRAAEPDEVASVIVMLASGYTSYLSGEVVSVSSQHP